MRFPTMWYVHTHSLIRAFASCFEYSMNIKLLTEHHLEFLSLNGGCTGWFESNHVKMLLCWKSHVSAHFLSISLCAREEMILAI